MAARRRYPGGDGYESYDYTYDYGHDSPGSYSFLSESWMTSYPASSSDGAKHMGPGRDSYGPPDRMDRYGVSEPNRGYGSQRAHHLPLSGWRDQAQGGYRGNFRPPFANRGSGWPMPLLNQAVLPEVAGYRSLRQFTVNSYFGGGFKQKSRKLQKLKKTQAEGGPPVKQARTSVEEDETKSEKSEGERDGDHEGAGTSVKNEGDDKQGAAEVTCKGEMEQKQILNEKQQRIQDRRMRDRMVERIQFVCSLCKFRTFFSEEMTSHLQSKFHKELFRYVGEKIPKPTADFLQEYILYKNKKTEERCKAIKDLNTTIQQIIRDQDLTQDFAMEHFVKKVETAHCAACDVFIPMNFRALQQHVLSSLHNTNRKNMMENSKKTALAVARSILDNKLISQKLACYIKGQNPFANDQTEVTESTNPGVDTATEGQAPVTTLEDHYHEEQEALTCSTTTSVNVKNTEDSAGVF